MSRDETKQFYLKNDLANSENEKLHQLDPFFIIGDLRNQKAIRKALPGIDIVLNLAALKQVPPYEYFPSEAINTNIIGVENLVNEIIESDSNIELMCQISTDKACKPVNVYGMTKAIAERITISGNLSNTSTKFFCVRYGNVLESRGSVIPIFKNLIEKNMPITLTHPEMTRFMMTLQESCDLIFRSIKNELAGTVLIPKLPSSKVIDIIDVLKEYYQKPNLPIKEIGIRPGEKIHEILISEEEFSRTKQLNNDYVLTPSLREDFFGSHVNIISKLIHQQLNPTNLNTEYSSKINPVSRNELKAIFKKLGVIN